MSLGIYSNPDSSSLLSENNTFTNPFILPVNGRTGGSFLRKLYLRNDDLTYFYTDIVLALEDNTNLNITDNNTFGYSWKLYYSSEQPSLNDWANTLPANSILFPSVGSLGSPDITSYIPFWVNITIPSNISIQVFSDVKFVITGNQVLA